MTGLQMKVLNEFPLSSALFQSSCWLRSQYPEDSPEVEIAEVCWQAFEALEELEARRPVLAITWQVVVLAILVWGIIMGFGVLAYLALT